MHFIRWSDLEKLLLALVTTCAPFHKDIKYWMTSSNKLIKAESKFLVKKIIFNLRKINWRLLNVPSSGKNIKISGDKQSWKHFPVTDINQKNIFLTKSFNLEELIRMSANLLSAKKFYDFSGEAFLL